MSAVPHKRAIQEHAGIDYLAMRGCTPEDASALGIQFVKHVEANALLNSPADKQSFYPNRDALWIPTRGPDGRLHPYHGQAIFFNPNKRPFKLHTRATVEYPNEVNFITPVIGLAPGSTVYWTESTLKGAILGRKLGLPTISMNGVFGFSKGRGQLCDSLKGLPPDLVHVLVTDSLNTKNKKSMTAVLSARRRWRLAVVAMYPTATTRFVESPKAPMGWPKPDWGLDDMYMSLGGAELVKKVVGNTQEFRDTSEVAAWLEEFKTAFVFVKSISKVYDREANQFLSKQNFFDNYASVNAGGDAVAPIWFKSSERTEVSTLVFRPGAEEFVEGALNVWQGFAVELQSNPEAVKEFWIDTAYDAFGDDAKHFIEFCAMLVQHPEKRLSRYLFIGGKQGTGKNYLIEALCRIFGKHFQPFTVDNFINNFNSTHAYCRLGVLNEPGDPLNTKGDVRVAVGEMLKKNADQNEKFFQLEHKGKDACPMERLQANIVLSNYGPPMVLDRADRRCIALLAGQHMGAVNPLSRGTKTLDYWSARWNWLNYEDGAAEIMAYLLAYPLQGVDMDGQAPMTKYKQTLLTAGSAGDSVKGFMEELNADPRGVFARAGVETGNEDLVFDAGTVALLYSALIHPVENEAAFTTTVGKFALGAWEVTSKQVSARGPKGPVGARVFGIKDDRIVALDDLGFSGTEAMPRLARLKLRLTTGVYKPVVIDPSEGSKL